MMEGRKYKRRMMAVKACAIAFALLVALGVPRAHAQCTAPSEGLVGHWTLDETAGTTANDSAGSNNGTMLGGLTGSNNAVATVGTGLDFDGTDDRIDMGDPAGGELDFGTSQSFTLSAWIRPDNITPMTRIISKGHWGWVSGYAMWLEAGKIIAGEAGGFQSDSTAAETSAVITNGNWYHVAAVFDQSGRSLKVYVNGTARSLSPRAGTCGTGGASGLNFAACANVNASSAEKLFIGSHTTNEYFNGVIDDARVYNRALSESEIRALSALRSTADAPAGFMTYDAKSAAMIYCDGTDWVHAGIGSYNPNAVTFDTDRLSGTLTGTDTKQATISFWYKRDTTAGNQDIFDTGTPDHDITPSATGIMVGFANSANADIFAVTSTAAATIDTATWHHYLLSFDLTDTNKRHLFIDGVLQAPTWSLYTNDFIDVNGPTYYIGSNNATDYYKGSLADLWIDYGTYLDLTQEENRRKFRSSTGMPMYLGPDGSIPTGTAPEIFLTGGTGSWHTNKGAGGGFTVATGAISTAATQPGVNIIPASADLTSSLLGYWPLNEGSGTSAADTSGNGANGTLAGDTAWQGTGVYGAGLVFDGTGDYVNIPATMNLGTQLTITGWFKTDTITADQSIFGIFDGSNDPNYYGLGLNQNWCVPMCLVGQTDVSPSWTLFAIDSNTDIVAGQWYFGAFSVNGNDLKIYVNGALEKSITIGANAGFSGTPEIGRSDTSWNWTYFDGALDDIRVYNRVLSDNDIKLLYACGVPQGTMKYDSTSSVMQYCNGAEWVPMGPVGGTPPASGLVAHWKMDETSGATAEDTAGAYDMTLNYMSPPANWTAGKLDNALDMDGVDDEGVALGLMGQPQNVTVAAWVNLDSTPDASGAEVLSIADYVGVRLDANGTESFGYYYTGTGWNNTWANVTFIGKGWQHIAYVFDDINDIQKLYIDGVEAGSTNYTESISYSGLGTDTYIGKNGNGGGFPYDGRIDDLRLYNRALGPQEISQIYNFGRSNGLGDVDNACASPSADEGEMVYNTDHNYMQYCNGERWVAIGK